MINGCTNESSTAQSEPEEQLYSVGDFAGAHILVSYAGARNAGPEITRTKEEAFAKAQELITMLEAMPDSFAAVAQKESDGPSGPRGGDLGTWMKGQMVPEFDAAVELLDISEVTKEPVETMFGYHVIQRNEVEKKPFYAADAFIVAFAGPQMPPEITRSTEEAQALADSIKEILTRDNFEELAMKYNDLSEDGPIPFPTFPEDGREPIPGLVDTLKALSFNEVDGPLSIPVGYAFVRRLEVDQRAGAHILISFQGAQNASPDITMTKEEALEEAKRITALAKGDPSGFADLAKEHSDGPSGPEGGDLGTWFKGRMVPEFDEAIDDLKPGEITDEPVETIFGYHIIIRNEVES